MKALSPYQRILILSTDNLRIRCYCLCSETVKCNLQGIVEPQRDDPPIPLVNRLRIPVLEYIKIHLRKPTWSSFLPQQDLFWQLT